MPLYLSVAAVQAEATPIPVPPDPTNPTAPPGQRVIAVVNNGEWQSALDVSHPDIYRRLRQRLAEGVWHELRLYAIDEQRAIAIADGRRATMRGQPVPDPARTAARR